MSSSDSWMHMDPVGLGEDVFGLFFSAQWDRRSSRFEYEVEYEVRVLAFEVVYILVPTMAMDDWLRVSEVVWLAGAQESLWFDL